MSDLDLVVVGGGPAGISAAIWAHTLHLRYAVLDAGATPGGQLHRVYNTIVDYPGVEPGDGSALAGRFAAHLDRLGVEVRSGSRVAAVDVAARAVEVDGARLDAAYLLLATGVRRRRLGVPGEAEFVGRGVSPSASKFAHLFRGRRVLVVGGGDAALEEALILADGCERVTLAHRSDRFRGRDDFRERVEAHPRIDVLVGAELEAIEGEGEVERARLRVGSTSSVLDVAGVFICVGVEPATDLVAGQLDLDERGFVRVDATQRTSADGVYAAGDVCSGSSWTIAAAVGEGAAAVKDVQRRLSAKG
jgi:thioredoxin reductase (NADPH)